MKFGHAYEYVKKNKNSLLEDVVAGNVIAVDIMVLWETVGTYPPNWEDHNKAELLDHVIRYLRLKGQLSDKCYSCGESLEEEYPPGYMCANCAMSEALKACVNTGKTPVLMSQFMNKKGEA